MDKTQHDLIANAPQKDSLNSVLEQQPTLSNFVKQAGLQELAELVEGDNFVACDLDLHGVQGCADMRENISWSAMSVVRFSTPYSVNAIAPSGRSRLYTQISPSSGSMPDASSAIRSSSTLR